MYICDGCGEDCNQITNVFIVMNLCNSCLQKWYRGELHKENKKEENKKEEENA